MRRDIRSIPQRKRVFIGCEGESERSYATLLQRIANDRQRPHVYLDIHVLNGGDPLAIVEAAIERERQQRGRHGNFAVRALLLDHDRHGQVQERDARIPALVASAGLSLIWQRPCFEALLLRHLPACQALRPATSALALQTLQQHWPEYRKPMSGQLLAARIRIEGVRNAAAVEAELDAVLRAFDFFSP